MKRINRPLLIKQDPKKPILILRRDDNEPLLMNTDGTYSFLVWEDVSGNRSIGYSYSFDKLMHDHKMDQQCPFYIPEYVDISVLDSNFKKDL